MSFFDEKEIQALKKKTEEDILKAKKEAENEHARRLKNKQVLRHTYDMYLEALKEFPSLANALGVMPGTVNEHYMKKKLFGYAEVNKTHSLYFICTYDKSGERIHKDLAVTTSGAFVTVEYVYGVDYYLEKNNALYILPFNPDSAFETSCCDSLYIGIGDQIYEPHDLKGIIYDLTYVTKKMDYEDISKLKLISFRDENQVREKIKENIFSKLDGMTKGFIGPSYFHA